VVIPSDILEDLIQKRARILANKGVITDKHVEQWKLQYPHHLANFDRSSLNHFLWKKNKALNYKNRNPGTKATSIP